MTQKKQPSQPATKKTAMKSKSKVDVPTPIPDKPVEMFNPDDWHSFPFSNREGSRGLSHYVPKINSR